jgi:hypothetical protein
MLPDEFFPRVAECLREQGWAATAGADGTIFIKADFTSQENRDAVEKARIECERAIDPSYLEVPPPLNDEQLHSMYDYDLAQAACLEERGYPHIDVPSFERYSTDLKGSFDPVSSLVEQGIFPTDLDIKECRDRDKPTWLATS